jgi:hypothetical protein
LLIITLFNVNTQIKAVDLIELDQISYRTFMLDGIKGLDVGGEA